MTNEIKTFDTGEKDRSNFIHVDLNPRQNIENKKNFKNLFNKIAECPIDELDEQLKLTYHEEVELNAFHPINEIKGIDDVKNKLWRPIKNALPDLERRNNLVIGGAFRGSVLSQDPTPS